MRLSLLRRALTLVYRRSLVYRKNIVECRFYCTGNNEPVKYSTSEAANWKAQFSRKGTPSEDESAWFQPYVVTLSVAVFLVYFCILREENDLDEGLSLTLYDRIEGLEENQLRMTLKYNLDHGLETSAIKKRLKELEEIRKDQY